MSTEQQLKRIQDKLQQLLKEHLALQKENTRLQKELSAMEKENKSQQELADDLKQKISILQVSAGEMNETDKKELEKRINAYIKEIDRCIALLSQ